ncbi:MAG: glycoside hydrolase family 3 C-terminal domain-containing protein, partial [Alphaproteobacteria bacterium]|nr:glycoside hydrolase family 3 C-terminal domain-containing protein [Alphaproteobacteria bacterium]
PFQAAVKAGVGSVMAAFNDVNGVPATADKKMMTGILRKEWGFKGFVVSDYTGINEMIAHGTGDLQHVSAKALKAGLDMDMVGEGFLTTLQKSLDEAKVSIKDIDRACRLILEAKWKLGLFDDPFRYLDPARKAASIMTPAHRAAAREIAAQSCVLLKNDNATLPLRKSGTIALIGPLADDKANMAGTWAVAGESKDSIGVLEGMRAAIGDKARILYAKGSNIVDDPDMAKKINVFHDALVGDIAAIDPRSPQDMRDEAVSIAQQSDIVIIVVGEAKEQSGECASRTDLNIPEPQRKLIAAIKETGKKIVLVTMSGRPLTLEDEHNKADAILHAWHAGTEAGHAIADVLFGDVNPSGKLTMTFPRNVGQLPIFYAHRSTGRPWGGHFEKFKTAYLDVPNDPLYAFGHGLSYSKFDYSPVAISKQKLSGDNKLTASVKVKNNSAIAGAEIVQLYITDPVAESTRPVRELKGFEKIKLQPGEEKTVSFTITPALLKYWNADLKHDWEGGEFIIHIGTASNNTQSASVTWDRVTPQKNNQIKAQP